MRKIGLPTEIRFYCTNSKSGGFDYHVCDFFGEEIMDKYNLIKKIIRKWPFEKIYESKSENIENAPYLLIKLNDPDERYEIKGDLPLDSKLIGLLWGVEDREFWVDAYELDDWGENF